MVKNALIKEGWTVTHDPYPLKTLQRNLKIDLGAEKLLAAKRGNKKIAVEIKSFIGYSQIHELYVAIGQISYYQWALDAQEPDRTLFLAVPVDIFETLSKDPIFKKGQQTNNIKLIAYNVDLQKIVAWDE